MINAFRKGYGWLLSFAYVAATGVAIMSYGMACRYILYEPPVPAKLREAR